MREATQARRVNVAAADNHRKVENSSHRLLRRDPWGMLCPEVISV